MGYHRPEPTECPNPNNNPKCGKVKLHGLTCRSCSKLKIRDLSVCTHCGLEFKYRNGTTNKFCSRTCFQKSVGSSCISHITKVPLELRLEKSKKSRENRTEEEKLEIHKKMSEITSLRTTTPEWKTEQSLKLTTKIANGDWQPFNNHKNGHYTTVDGRDEFYASSWELARMMQLDSEGKVWTKKHKIKIPYQAGEVCRHYTPDIMVENLYLEEIKPPALLTERLNILKIEAGKSYCIENNLQYRIITDTELGEFIKKALKYHEINTKPK